MILIVMGVSGCGKSAVGKALSNAIPNSAYIEGDDYHSISNISKMGNQQPLTDDDRIPWISSICKKINSLHDTANIVISCSCLKTAYRDIFRSDINFDSIRFVWLHGSKELILSRMQARKGHFMKSDMLDSQFSTLEPPLEREVDDMLGPYDVSQSIQEIVHLVLQKA